MANCCLVFFFGLILTSSSLGDKDFGMGNFDTYIMCCDPSATFVDGCGMCRCGAVSPMQPATWQCEQPPNLCDRSVRRNFPVPVSCLHVFAYEWWNRVKRVFDHERQ